MLKNLTCYLGFSNGHAGHNQNVYEKVQQKNDVVLCHRGTMDHKT